MEDEQMQANSNWMSGPTPAVLLAAVQEEA
jgi:hypothetical protein